MKRRLWGKATFKGIELPLFFIAMDINSFETGSDHMYRAFSLKERKKFPKFVRFEPLFTFVFSRTEPSPPHFIVFTASFFFT